MVWVLSLSDLDLSTQALTAGAMLWHSEFIRGWQAVKPPSPIGSSTSITLFPTLHLNAFRGVRAISEFDWPFTPTHRSSEDFSTSTGSVLHPDTIGTSTCPWVDHTVSRLAPVALALFRLAFASPPSLKDLNLLLRTNSQDHYAKGTLSPLKAPTACKHTVSGSFSLSFLEFFSPFPHGTSSLSVSREYLALENGLPIFRQNFTGSALLDSTVSFSSTRLSLSLV